MLVLEIDQEEIQHVIQLSLIIDMGVWEKTKAINNTSPDHRIGYSEFCSLVRWEHAMHVPRPAAPFHQTSPSIESPSELSWVVLSIVHLNFRVGLQLCGECHI